MAGSNRGKKREKDTPADSPPPQKKQKTTKASTTKHDSHTHACGQVLALGEGDTGQLGLGPDIMERTKPAKVALPPDVVQTLSGGMHTVCLNSKGEVFSFGCNDEGALGRKTADDDEMMEPGQVELPAAAVQVSAGDSHSAALMEDGRVFAWGTFRDANGTIGLLPDGTRSEIPVEMMSGLKIMKICSGVDHLVCLTEEGVIYTCGSAEQGQLGRVAECFSARGGRKGLEYLLTPAIVNCKKRKVRFSDVWAGSWSTFAKDKETGKMYAWGLNNYYQLGFDDMENRFTPEVSKNFAPDLDWQQVSCGQHHTIALDKAGHVYALGRKEYGRLGLGEAAKETAVPTKLTTFNGHKCVSIGTGSAVSFAVMSSGDLFAWGMGSSKQLGQTEEDDLWEPVKMTGKQLETRSVLMASAGGQHTILLAKDSS